MNHHDPYESLRGKPYIAAVRCSTMGQADTSIPDQLRVIREFAQRYGMIEVGVVILEGVSGSIPGNRQDLQALLDRKREKDDFEVLLLQDTTRLTRGGHRHAHKVEWEFLAEGVEIVYVLEQMVTGDAGELYMTFQYHAARQQARSISKNATRRRRWR